MPIDQLKVLRKQANFSQEYLGGELEISQSTYNKKENGIIPFSLEEIKELKTILNLDNRQIINIFLD
ncbi:MULTISPECIES: helix-turn-helix transcriptional regulator [Clostridium]|jgi:Helix-turn-helix.|uniref:Helix-turn-helix transcriptional regulator n=2 Tax=Clostridium beijerinckii TaxID=1520 RepID=A0A7Y8ZIM1_CLOBE|nr:helix-turn-helix transcriptional regulator [Clostridium beijerinckii]ABR33071.1 helix-turn-helix domain protein [Clostridium beijerinckii NCIMB 8052]AIU02524.1 helix-turn-helix domain-containing protein [Clostridium beijerinckii ATCC 35702]AQS03493.1 helix-turn-helix domain protein [Clostridium beijerinckii]MBA2884749.1 transcriptional regulator with XRE-family HTH domain [Clostridium beijerinckii]MBA2899471.1 transcriptional regulator with XRE-family HTH domain [Clostridium beijerinckii]